MERRITIDNRDLHLSEDGFCKEVLRQIADALAENPLEPGLYQIDLNIRKCRMPDIDHMNDIRRRYEEFRKTKLYKEVYDGKSLGDVMPIEE